MAITLSPGTAAAARRPSRNLPAAVRTRSPSYNATQGVAFNLASTTTQTVFGSFTVTLVNSEKIENLVGGSYSDDLKGNSLSNYIFGDAGSDTIGPAGDDYAYGGSGLDFLYGSEVLGAIPATTISTAKTEMIVHMEATITAMEAATIRSMAAMVMISTSRMEALTVFLERQAMTITMSPGTAAAARNRHGIYQRRYGHGLLL